jgi:hypothetical protein
VNSATFRTWTGKGRKTKTRKKETKKQTERNEETEKEIEGTQKVANE